MKKLAILLVALGTAIMFSSCAFVFSDAGMGSLYTSAKGPVAVTGNKLGTKVGTGDQTNILGLIVQGDASVNSIAKNAGISKVSHVDYEVSTILGFFGTKRIVVYGE